MQKSPVHRFFSFFKQLEIHEILIFFTAVFFMSYFALVSFLGTTDFLAVVVSDSMEPALHKGDMVFLSANTPVNQGDIIVFKKNSETIIHRVIEITPNGFRTKGDKNPYKDLFIVQKNEVIGKVVFSVPKILP